MRFKVYLLRRRGRRLPWLEVINGPSYVGDLCTHTTRYGLEDVYVATLKSVDSSIAPPQIPDLHAPVLLGFAPLAFRLRGFERIGKGVDAFSVVQEWHIEPP